MQCMILQLTRIYCIVKKMMVFMSKKMIDDYFPQGLAFGQAFLGRETEKAWLSQNIKQRHHTVLIAPRRFGKTSLILNVLRIQKIPFIELNFHLIISAKSVEKKIIDGVLNIMNQFVSTPEYKLKVIRSFFTRAKKKWTIGFKDIIGLELIPDENSNAADNIYTAFLLLDELLGKKKSKAVFFIDEIQELSKIEESFQIEGALRDFAQRSKNLTFIFSGSNRRLLVDMFNNREKPLYELCDQMTLEKLPKEVYVSYFDLVAVETWGEKLSSESIDKIFQLTERHPRRVYNLCFYLWRLNENKKIAPKSNEVQEAWNYFVGKRLKNTRDALSSLSKGQLKVLAYIALDHHEELSGQRAQRELMLASSSITRFIKILEDEDYIEVKNNHAHIIDPLIKEVLSKYESSVLAS